MSMKKVGLIALVGLTLHTNKAWSETVIVAPGSNPATLYINRDVGTTVRFERDIKLITPRRFYSIEKTTSRHIYIKAKGAAQSEEVTIVAGSDDLNFRLVTSREASRYVKIMTTSDKSSEDRRVKLLKAMTTGSAQSGITVSRLDGESIELYEQRLKPHLMYKYPPYIGVVWQKLGDLSPTFKPELTSLGPATAELWSANFPDRVIYILKDRQHYTPVAFAGAKK